MSAFLGYIDYIILGIQMSILVFVIMKSIFRSKFREKERIRMDQKSKIVVEVTTSLPTKVVAYLCKDRTLGTLELLALLGCDADFSIISVNDSINPKFREDNTHEI